MKRFTVGKLASQSDPDIERCMFWPQKMDVDRSPARFQRYVLLGALPVDFRVPLSAFVFVLLGAWWFFKLLIVIYKIANFRCVTRARAF